MEPDVKRLFIITFALALTACNLPKPHPPTPEMPGNLSTECAFVEARQALPELSTQFLNSLKEAALPVETARAEAYGENCLAVDNTVVRFAARETDFYVTLNVDNLSDETALGSHLDKILDIIDKVPLAQTGPPPGYIGVTFKAGNQLQNLWFTQARANELRAQGLKGADLYRALKNKS